MKPAALLGLFLIVVGLAALVYQGVTYTAKDRSDLGHPRTADRQKTLPLSPSWGLRQWQVVWPARLQCAQVPSCALVHTVALVTR